MDLLAQPRQILSSVLAATGQRAQSPEEERANSLSHALGLGVALMAGAALVITAAQQGHTAFTIGVGVYVISMAILYFGSTMYHALPDGPAKSAWLICDHAAIYLFIAGSYTPFTLGALRGPVGTALLIIIWTLALAGVAFKIIGGAERYPKLSTAFYMAMGWVFLLAAGQFLRLIPAAGIWWLLGGGAAYTLGVAFFRAERMRYGHFIWHLFVLTGTICHFIAVWHYASGV